MSLLAGSALTLADLAKQLEPDGGVTTQMVELLAQDNEILDDMLWKEGNLPTGNRTFLRTSLPIVTPRKINEGVAKTKSTSATRDEGAAMLETRSEVDVKIADLSGNVKQFRMNEAAAHMEAMSQKVASLLFYGNALTTDTEFTGLAPRYNSLSGTGSQNVLSGGGSGSDNTSIWFVNWTNNVCGIYPKGSKAGLSHEDLGTGDAFDASNNRFRAYMDRFTWDCGLNVGDWRRVVRIPNIDVSNLVAESSAADLIKLMSRAMDRLPRSGSSGTNGRTAIYCNRTVYSMLKIQCLNKSNNALGINQALKQVEFLGIPIRMCDAILNTEAAVS